MQPGVRESGGMGRRERSISSLSLPLSNDGASRPLPVVAPVICFLVDNCVHEGVVDYLRGTQHEVHTVRETLGHATSDRDIAKFADLKRQIIVTGNYVDFRPMIHKRPPTAHDRPSKRLRYAGLIGMLGRQHRVPQRFEECFDIIESEFRRTRGLRDERLIMTIGDEFVRVER